MTLWRFGIQRVSIHRLFYCQIFKSSNNFFSGITSNTYKKRAEILVASAKPCQMKEFPTFISVDCAETAADSCAALLKESPVFEQVVSCSQCGHTKKLNFSAVATEISELEQLEQVIQRHLTPMETECSNCQGSAEMRVETIGKYSFSFLVFSKDFWHFENNFQDPSWL